MNINNIIESEKPLHEEELRQAGFKPYSNYIYSWFTHKDIIKKNGKPVLFAFNKEIIGHTTFYKYYATFRD